jgi:hypothetical protein
LELGILGTSGIIRAELKIALKSGREVQIRVRSLVLAAIIALSCSSAFPQDHSVDFDKWEKQLAKLWSTASDLESMAEVDSVVQKLHAGYLADYRLQELAWLNFSYGDSKDGAELENRIERELREAAVADDVPISAKKSDIRILTLATGLKAVWRPLGPEDWRDHVLPYDVSRGLGFNLVPVTTRRKHKNVDGVIQTYIADARHGNVNHRIFNYKNPQLYLLDYLIEYYDRKGDNYLIRPGGFDVAVDNAMIYGSYASTIKKLQPNVSVPAMILPGNITANNKAAVERLSHDIKMHPQNYRFSSNWQKAFLLAQTVNLLEVPLDCEDALQRRK